MSNKETISILITCLNGERYIKRCIDSILNQTYQNFIIIFLNDGSVDNTKKIISIYMKQDEFFKIVGILIVCFFIIYIIINYHQQ
jgi:glycosyltransferase EpsH